MPHVDWRPRLSLALPPEAAKELRDRIPHGNKTRMFRSLIEQICTAKPGDQVALTVNIGNNGRMESWHVLAENIETARKFPSKNAFLAP